MKRLIPVIFLLASVCVTAKEPTNIIYVIGDGMGAAYTSAYRFYADNPATPELDATIFDQLLVGMATTHPVDHSLITDSASAATALATGIKTSNRAIGVDVKGKPLLTLLERAKKQGYTTGIIVTSAITHATPASFVAHVTDRKQSEKIADQYFDSRIDGKLKVDLMFGGGRYYFQRADRDLVKEFKLEGYAYLENVAQLDKVENTPALGLFADEGFDYALGSEQPLRLTQMTEKALALLNKKPFFLLVEASQIDWCGHANDIACAMAEMHDFDKTLRVIKSFIDKNPNTIMVATADHSTGGLSIASHDHYFLDATAVKKIKVTLESLTQQLLRKGDQWESVWVSLTDIELDTTEKKQLQALIKSVEAMDRKKMSIAARDKIFLPLTRAIQAIIDQRSHTSWTTTWHTGEEVQVFSHGVNSQQFSGTVDNTDLAKKLQSYLPDEK